MTPTPEQVEEALWRVEHDPLSDRGDWDLVIAAELRRLREEVKRLNDALEAANRLSSNSNHEG